VTKQVAFFEFFGVSHKQDDVRVYWRPAFELVDHLQIALPSLLARFNMHSSQGLGYELQIKMQ